MEKSERNEYIYLLFLWKYMDAEPGFGACNLFIAKM